MRIELHAYTNGKEYYYNNIRHISVGIEYRNAKPIYQLKFLQGDNITKISLEDVTGFDIHDGMLCWRHNSKGYLCPYCGFHLSNTLYKVLQDKRAYHCPECGNRVDYEISGEARCML